MSQVKEEQDFCLYIESVHEGDDGLVREVMVAYKHMEEGTKDTPSEKAGWRHMVVLRPVRNMIKLFSVEDTTLMQDLEEVRKLCANILDDKQVDEADAKNETKQVDEAEIKQNDDKSDTTEETNAKSETKEVDAAGTKQNDAKSDTTEETDAKSETKQVDAAATKHNDETETTASGIKTEPEKGSKPKKKKRKTEAERLRTENLEFKDSVNQHLDMFLTCVLYSSWSEKSSEVPSNLELEKNVEEKEEVLFLI